MSELLVASQRIIQYKYMFVMLMFNWCYFLRDKYTELLANFNELHCEKTVIQQQFVSGSSSVKAVEENLKVWITQCRSLSCVYQLVCIMTGCIMKDTFWKWVWLNRLVKGRLWNSQNKSRDWKKKTKVYGELARWRPKRLDVVSFFR